MQPGFICVAGINQETGKHVRPVRLGRLKSEMLVRNGGPFDIASEVDLGEVTYQGHPPVLEDYFFDPQATKKAAQGADPLPQIHGTAVSPLLKIVTKNLD